MKQSVFESHYQAGWQAFAEQLQGLERGKAKPEHSHNFAADIAIYASNWRWPKSAVTAVI